MSAFVKISRLLVGSLFIVSGLIKANDPLGFSYKLHDYFAEDVLNLVFLNPFALSLAIFICVVEIILGIAVVFGSKSKLVAWSLLLMIIFFTFLTFYSAYFNKVTDCGCFGDALKLTPWQSFSKDIVLLIFILPIFLKRNKILQNTVWDDLLMLPSSIVLVALFSVLVIGWWLPVFFTIICLLAIFAFKNFIKISHNEFYQAGIATIISLGFSLYCVAYLPVKDFRPYAIGKSISEGMKIPEGAQPDRYENYLTYFNTKTQEERKFTFQEFIDEGISENTDWEWRNTENVLVEKGYEPPIHDFNLIGNDGGDYTYDVLEEEFIMLFFYYDIKNSSTKPQPRIAEIASFGFDNGVYSYGLTASSYENYESFRHEHQLPFDFLTADETMLKTVVRSNPGLVLLNKGRVIGKWPHVKLPSNEELKHLMGI